MPAPVITAAKGERPLELMRCGLIPCQSARETFRAPLPARREGEGMLAQIVEKALRAAAPFANSGDIVLNFEFSIVSPEFVPGIPAVVPVEWIL